MKFIYSKKFIYSVFFLSSFIIYSIITQFIISTKSNIRFLSDDDGVKEICEKNENLYNYYYQNDEYEVTNKDFGKIDRDSQIILDYINEDYNSKYIFKYIWYTGKYVFFLILLIIIIILAIYFSIASCVKHCKENCCDFFCCSCCKSACLKRSVCVFIPIIYFIVFILVFFSIILAISALEKFSGTICIGLQLVDSFIEGETRQVSPKWAGIFVISDILKKLGNITSNNNQKIVDEIFNNKKIYENKNNEWIQYLEKSYLDNLENGNYKHITINSPKMSLIDEEITKNITPFFSYLWGPYNKSDTILDKINQDKGISERIHEVFSKFDEYLYILLGCNLEENEMKCSGFSEISILLNSGAEIIESIKNPLSDLKSKITKPVQNIYDEVNSTAIGIFALIMLFIIIYCISIEITLSIFCCSKKCQQLECCLKWFFCFIYYTSIFIVIIGLTLGIVIGFIGNLVQDMTQVIEYILSSENLNKTNNSIIFGNSSYTKYLDVCLNGNGNLAESLNLINNFYIINNIANVTDDADNLKNDTEVKESLLINEYISFFNNLQENYLNISYYELGNNSTFNITDKIKEINKYVSGEYYSDKNETCMINENWNIKKSEEGYTYDPSYPSPDTTSHYLIYLYDKDVYDKANLTKRYDKVCPTEGHPYTTVSEASIKFGQLFEKIGNDIIYNNFSRKYLDDLRNLSKLYEEKNKYINSALNSATFIISQIVETFRNYLSGDEHNIFSLLNCKFVGNNKLMLLDILYTSLGIALDLFGTITIIISLLIFLGVIFILIIIKNSNLNEKNGIPNISLTTLENILKGEKQFKDIYEENEEKEDNEENLVSGIGLEAIN